MPCCFSANILHKGGAITTRIVMQLLKFQPDIRFLFSNKRIKVDEKFITLFSNLVSM